MQVLSGHLSDCLSVLPVVKTKDWLSFSLPDFANGNSHEETEQRSFSAISGQLSDCLPESLVFSFNMIRLFTILYLPYCD